MKAILVFEVDEDVFKELEKTSDLDIRFKYHDTMYVSKEKRIINYSLNPMPKKIEVNVEKIEDIMHTEFRTIDIIQDKYIADIKLDTDKLIAIGYNQCIDELLGGTKWNQ